MSVSEFLLKVVTLGTFATCWSTKYENNLRVSRQSNFFYSVRELFFNTSLCKLPYWVDILSSVNLNNFTLFLIEIDNWLWLVIVGLKTLPYDFFSVINTAASLCTFKASCSANFLRCVEIKNGIRYSNNFFKMFGLVKCSWEAVNQVVLKRNEK